jgi:AbiV family abortive infection protein
MDETVSTIIANAERLLADANQLAAAGSFRTAISLVILSFEESGKACIVYWQKAGFITNAAELLKHHIEKQRIFASYRAIVAIDKFGMLKRKDEPGKSIDFSEFKRSFSEEYHKQALPELLVLNMNMNDYLKEAGFYADINPELNLVKSYTSFDQTQFEPQAKRAEEALTMARASDDFQKMMAFVHTAKVQLHLTSKQRKEQQQRFFTVMDALYESGMPRPGSDKKV